ncbi:hypothetical protein SNEBB_003507 [Seison nebaliae]|nr:hypothetical protein SNEBB_003507 [Seison nebaliae]
MKRRKTSRNFEAQSKQIDVHENLKSTILEKKNTRDKSFENLCKLELDGSENLSTDEFSEEQLSEEQLSEDQLSEKNFVQEFSKNKSKDLICNELRSMFHNHKTSKKSSMNFPKNYDSLIKSDNSMSNDLHLDEEHPHFGVDHQLSLILTNMRKMDKKLDRLFDKVYRLEEITMLSGNITYSTEFSRIRDMFPLETIEKYNELNDEMKSDVKLSENLGKFFFLFRKETLQNSINNIHLKKYGYLSERVTRHDH